MSLDIIVRLQIEPDLLRRVITGDERWIFQYDPETHRLSSQWKSPTLLNPKKTRQSKLYWSCSLTQWVLVTGPDNQSASPLRDPVGYASLSAQNEKRVVAGQIVAASTWKCTCSQRPKHPAVPGWEELCYTETTFWSYSVRLFSFFPSS